MDVLMVADPQPTARYQPAEPYINRAAPKSRGWLERERDERNRKEEKHKQSTQFLGSSPELPYQK